MKQHLNFNWFFIKGFLDDYILNIPSEAKSVDIPHHMADLPFNSFSDIQPQIVGTYFKKVIVDGYDPECSYLLHFEGVMVSASVYINGKDMVKD